VIVDIDVDVIGPVIVDVHLNGNATVGVIERLELPRLVDGCNRDSVAGRQSSPPQEGATMRMTTRTIQRGVTAPSRHVPCSSSTTQGRS
jgi:hypothetical protein